MTDQDTRHVQASAVRAPLILDALVSNGIDAVTAVPDFVQFSVHDGLEHRTHPIRYFRCCTEEQAVCMAAGLYVGGRKPVLVMQNQGLYACINALRAVGLDAQMPICLLVGQFGREFANLGKDPRTSSRRMVRLLEPVLDALEIRHWRLESPDDLPNISRAIDWAFAHQTPAVVAVGAYTDW